MPTYKAKENEDWFQIARVHGFRNWRTIYDHEKNAAFRERPDSLVLYKEDEIYIPDKKPEEHICAVNEKHIFVLPKPKRIIGFVFEDDFGEPFANVKYEIWADGKKQEQRAGRTRRDGLVYEEVSIFDEIEIRFWLERENESDPNAYISYPIQMGHLDPVHTIEGIQDRLMNLGYNISEEEYGKTEKNGELCEETKEAIIDFQNEYGLNPTGEPDDETKAMLLKIHDNIIST